MIQIEKVSKKYRTKEVLRDISIEAPAGSLVALVGRNGCGKTTLLKIIAGVIKPDNGKILFWGHDATREKKYFSKYCGFIPQDNPLIEDLTVKDNIKFWAASVKNPDLSLIDDYQLNDIMNEKVSNLSGGMKRRLAIVCIMLRKPPVLILDEPTASLDLYFQNSILESLMDYKKRNGTVIFSTHNQSEIENVDICYVFDEDNIIRYNKKDIDIELIKKIIAPSGNK